MSFSVDQRISRILGGLLGVHTGDSLGATLEFMPWTEIRPTYPNGLREIVGGGAFNWPAGHATDDTDLTRAVLLAYHDYEEQKQTANDRATKALDVTKTAADYSLKWYEGDWPDREKGSNPVDIGGATRLGLLKYRKSRDPTTCGAGVGSAGNGSLMRLIPTGLFVQTTERRQRESMAISAFTHNDPRCTVACAAYNEIVATLIQGKTPAEAVEAGKTIAQELNGPKVVQAIEDGKLLPLAQFANEGPGNELPSWTSGYVLQSLKLSIAALLDPRSFEDVLVDVVRIGGDTDTNGAIAGGLLGARDGVEEIPKRWLDKLQFREEFEKVAMHILQLQQPTRT